MACRKLMVSVRLRDWCYRVANYPYASYLAESLQDLKQVERFEIPPARMTFTELEPFLVYIRRKTDDPRMVVYHLESLLFCFSGMYAEEVTYATYLLHKYYVQPSSILGCP